MAIGHVVTSGGGSGGSTAWADVTGKPATFPPSTHAHAYADITGKPATFPPAAHAHVTGDVTGLDAALASAPRIFVHNGTTYVLAPDADVYIGPADPGVMPAGSLWIDTDA